MKQKGLLRSSNDCCKLAYSNEQHTIVKYSDYHYIVAHMVKSHCCRMKVWQSISDQVSSTMKHFLYIQVFLMKHLPQAVSPTGIDSLDIGLIETRVGSIGSLKARAMWFIITFYSAPVSTNAGTTGRS